MNLVSVWGEISVEPSSCSIDARHDRLLLIQPRGSLATYQLTKECTQSPIKPPIYVRARLIKIEAGYTTVKIGTQNAHGQNVLRKFVIIVLSSTPHGHTRSTKRHPGPGPEVLRANHMGWH